MYLFTSTTDCRRVRSLGPSVTCVRTRPEDPLSTVKAKWRLALYDTEAYWIMLVCTALFVKVSEPDNQTSSGKQGFKRLGHVVVQSTQGRGLFSRQEYRSLDDAQSSPVTKCPVASRRPFRLTCYCGLERYSSRRRDATVQIPVQFDVDEPPHQTVNG